MIYFGGMLGGALLGLMALEKAFPGITRALKGQKNLSSEALTLVFAWNLIEENPGDFFAVDGPEPGPLAEVWLPLTVATPESLAELAGAHELARMLASVLGERVAVRVGQTEILLEHSEPS